MNVNLKYGYEGLTVNLPETPNFKGLITPDEPSVVKEPLKKIYEMLEAPIDSKPLSDIAKDRKNAVVVISDITRPVPNETILPPILKTIENAGIKRENITILIATGIHRPNKGEELVRLVGKEIAETYEIVNHLSKNDNDMGLTGYIGNGKVPVYINKHYLNADLKILTGFIEPHLWAGFSGGRKSILPGVSSIKTLEYMHGPEMVAHENTAYGILDGNPFHEAGIEIMEKAGADFIVNVTLNTDKEITGIFAGHPVKAHIEGCNFLSEYCIKYIDEPLDFILTTNAGAPLDINLYQTVKGMSVSAPVLKKGGTILIVSKCFEGLGSPEYVEVLNMIDTPENFLKRLMNNEFFIPDQWCAQETYRIITEHPTWIYSHGVDKETLKKYFFHPVDSVEGAVKKLLTLYGNNASWAILPDGPMVIVKLKKG
jgi:nickel-dependent lactate racemase